MATRYPARRTSVKLVVTVALVLVLGGTDVPGSTLGATVPRAVTAKRIRFLVPDTCYADPETIFLPELVPWDDLSEDENLASDCRDFGLEYGDRVKVIGHLTEQEPLIRRHLKPKSLRTLGPDLSAFQIAPVAVRVETKRGDRLWVVFDHRPKPDVSPSGFAEKHELNPLFKAMLASEGTSILEEVPPSQIGSGDPDLVPSISPPAGGEACSVDLDIENRGTGAAIFPDGPVRVAVVRPPKEKAQVVRVYVTILPPGGRLAFAYEPGFGIPEGITTEVDPDGVIAEVDETNNTTDVSLSYECELVIE